MDPAIDDINRIIYLLAEHKKSVSRLYDNYAIKFPDRPYWKDLSQAKQKHHQIIQSIYFDTKVQAVAIDESVFRSIAIKTSLDWVNRLIDEYVKHTLLNALSYALDLEQAKIEQRYFDIFKKDSPEIQQMLPDLITQSQQNIEFLREELEKIRQSEPVA